jgi:hypothetical protein
MANVVAHRTAVFSYPPVGRMRFGWDCLDIECGAGGLDIASRDDAELAARSHTESTWGRP